MLTLSDEFGDVSGWNQHFEGIVDVSFFFTEKLVADVEKESNNGLDVFQLATDDAGSFLFLEQSILLLLLKADAAFGLLFNFLQQFLFLLLQKTDELVGEDELALDFTFGVV